jgi:hypothetical protein
MGGNLAAFYVSGPFLERRDTRRIGWRCDGYLVADELLVEQAQGG